MRKVLFWLHLTAGVTAGLVILIMCVTGAALAFEKQINAWLEKPEVEIAPPADGSPHLPVETILAKAKEQNPVAPSSITLRSGRTDPAEVGAGRGGTLRVNPYTGDILSRTQAGQPGQANQSTARAFFRRMEDWHRWLGGTGANRNRGKAIMDAGNLVFFGIICSGLFLWLPKKFTWQHLRPSLLFRGGLSGKARDWNWHNVIGIWAWVPLVLVVGSGVIMSYPWASNLLYTMTGSPLPPQPGAGPGRGGGQGKIGPGEGPGRSASAKGGPAGGEGRGPGGPGFGGFGGGAPANWEGLNVAWAKAEQQVSGWQSIRVQGSPNPNAPFTFNIDRGDGGQPQLRGTLVVGRDGQVVNWTDFSDNSTGQKLRLLARFTHTGESLGVWGQAIAGLATAGGAVMVYTGIALALRRLFAWRRRRGQPQEDAVPITHIA